MKKLLSFLAVAGLTCSALTGCVEDNSTVVAKGLISSALCSASSEEQTYLHSFYCDPSATMKDGSPAYMHIALHIMNYMEGNPVWSSGASGSGTTLNITQPNAGSIFIDTVHIECDSVDGSKDGCSGRDGKTINGNFNIGSGGGLCLGFTIDVANEFAWGNEVVLDIYADYHDSSLVKGKTSHTKFTFILADSKRPAELKFADACTLERDEPDAPKDDEGENSEDDENDDKK